MKKIKFLKARFPDSLDEVSRKITNHPFEIGVSNGFEPITLSENCARAKFIEEVTTKEKITDPFGNVEVVISKRYVISDFSILKGSDHQIVALQNPPRPVKPLIKKLSEVFGSTFYASAIEVNILELSTFLPHAIKTNSLRNTKVLLSGVNLDENSSAIVEITSLKDALLAAQDHFDGKDFKIERARFSSSSSGNDSVVEIRSTGLASAYGQDEDELLQAVQKFVMRFLG